MGKFIECNLQNSKPTQDKEYKNETPNANNIDVEHYNKKDESYYKPNNDYNKQKNLINNNIAKLDMRSYLELISSYKGKNSIIIDNNNKITIKKKFDYLFSKSINL